jgi:hypothetical protein
MVCLVELWIHEKKKLRRSVVVMQRCHLVQQFDDASGEICFVQLAA